MFCINVDEPVCLQEKGRNFIDMLGRAHVLDLLYFMLTTEKPVRFNEIELGLLQLL